MSARSLNEPTLSRTMHFRKCAKRQLANRYGRRAAMRALAVASGSAYSVGFCSDCAPMKAAVSEFLRWMSGMKPQPASSASRRSLMAISVGHFMSTPPSSLGNVCTGKPSTVPPDSTPRMDEHQPYILNERLMFTAIAYAEFAQEYWLESGPFTASSNSNSSTGLVFAPYGRRARNRGRHRPRYLASSESRNERHAA